MKDVSKSERRYNAQQMLEHVIDIENGNGSPAKLAAIRNYLEAQIEHTETRKDFVKRNNMRDSNQAEWRHVKPASFLNRATANLQRVLHLRKGAQEDLNQADDAICDIMHELELESLTESEKRERVNDLIELRRIRRKAKDFIFQTNILKTAKYEAIVQDLQQLTNKLQSNHCKAQQRQYSSKQRSS